MELHTLKPPSGTRKTAKRVGRGNASGWGRTAAKGEKGQKARSGGKIPAWFQGGQLPLYRKIPKVGFRSRVRIKGLNVFNLVNLSDLESFSDGDTVNLETLRSVGLATSNKKRAGLKVLGRGEISKKLTVQANAISETAKKKIEAAGGKVEMVSASTEASDDKKTSSKKKAEEVKED